MSHKRVKAITAEDDFDDDYDYDEEEEGDLSAEDKEQLRLGTLEVRKTLGSDFTDAEIQESLWHYYYDVAKTISYLKNKQTPKKAKTTPAKQSSASKTAKTNDDFSEWFTTGVSTCSVPFTAHDFFKDSPWLRIPQKRQSVILVEPLYPSLGLLGGASTGDGSKMSKLAALAAKRRQKENEKIVSTSTSTPAGETPSGTGAYKSSLDRLRSKDYSTRASELAKSKHSLSSCGKSQTTAEPTTITSNDVESGSSVTVILGTEGLSSSQSSAPPEESANKHETEPATPTGGGFSFEDASQLAVPSLQRRPSAFARTVMGDGVAESSFAHGSQHDADWKFYIYGLESNNTNKFDFSDPSPDDVVLNAQKGTKLGKFGPKHAAGEQAKTELVDGVKDLSVSEVTSAQIVQNKNLDVIAEYKKAKRKNAANFVVIGHVDAGKSTLMGRLLFDLKAIDQRTMDKYKAEAERIGKGSFAFAWVLDSGAEERARGVTIDIAANRFETEKTNFTILDAPGHRDFVPNMIAGASQADFAVLVIDASIGSFEAGMKGQTKEHALLVRSMGVQKLIVAINKMDTVSWSKDRFDEISQQMSAFLGTVGFDSAKVSFIPCSGLQGLNILNPLSATQASWYSGSTLVEALDSAETSTPALEKPLRMIIDDAFQSSINNPHSISGRLDTGTLQVGENIQIMPANIKASIKSVIVDDEPSDWAVAGQNVIINLTNISDEDAEQIHSGSVACSPKNPLANINSFTAKVLAFDHLMPMPVDVLRGRIQVAAMIKTLVGTLDKATGEVVRKKPKIVQPGAVARLMIELRTSVPLEKGDRVVLRSGGETVGTGMLE